VYYVNWIWKRRMITLIGASFFIYRGYAGLGKNGVRGFSIASRQFGSQC
jgi:hypothetical protein